MSVIKVQNIGGVLPSVQTRLLGPEASQTALNLTPSTPDFRPLANDTTVATIATNNPLTIYRLARKADGSFNTDPSTGWVVSSQLRSYVKGQLNDDIDERTYYTIDSVDAPPRTTDANGADRQLGVPAPATRPTVSLVANDEYTAEDQTLDLGIVAGQVVAALQANITKQWIGADVLGSDITGPAIAPRAAPEFDNPDESQLVRLYAEGYYVASDSYVLTDTYAAATPAEMSWVYSPGLGGFHEVRTLGTTVIPATVTPVPGPAETQFLWAVPFHGRGVTYKINQAAFKAAMQAISVGGQPAITADQAQTLVDRFVDYFEGDFIKPTFQSHRSKTVELLALLDGLQGSANAVKGFYADSEIATLINAEKDALAEALWQHASSISTARDFYSTDN